MSEVTVRAPAKVNLGLSVGPPGADGYHELVNVFHAVSLFDEVTARPAADRRISVEVDGAGADQVPLGEGNLAVRAARLLAERAGTNRGVRLHIRKSIPVAGGMAGGSADAAAALLACDALWGSGAPHRTLLELAGRLGADVAFPLVGGTAVGTGRGERLRPAVAGPAAEGAALHWAVAPAGDGLSAGVVYAECDRLRALAGGPVAAPYESRELLAALADGDSVAIGAALHNDLQAAALSLRPGLRELLEIGCDNGALGALVSGSGPTCAFLAGSARHAAELAAALEGAGPCRGARQVYGPVPGARIVDPGAEQ